MLRFRFLCIAAILPALLAQNSWAHGELIGVASLAGDAVDRSGLEDPQNEGVNRLGGFSALDYAGGNRYFVLSDRGPLDGAIDYLCRYHIVSIDIDEQADEPVKLSLVETRMLTDQSSLPFTGLSSEFAASRQYAGRLDPEGIRASGDERFILSDEYGPDVIEFSNDGRELRRLCVPEFFQVKFPAASKHQENAANTTGRQSNNGLEGLARTPAGKFFGLMQKPLIQDSQTAADGSLCGTNCRLIELRDNHQQTGRQFIYQLDRPENKLNEILALTDDRFLVIERDGLAGQEAKYKRLMLIDIAGATDVSGQLALDNQLPASIVPVTKEVFIDLLNPAHGLSGPQMPEKIEGLAFGPDLSDGRRSLIVCSDNDFVADHNSMFYVFAIETTGH